jgi:hypothetical protein
MSRRRQLILILLLAAFWALSGYVIGAALEAIGFSYRLGMMCGSINLIIGMVLQGCSVLKI